MFRPHREKEIYMGQSLVFPIHGAHLPMKITKYLEGYKALLHIVDVVTKCNVNKVSFKMSVILRYVPC